MVEHVKNDQGIPASQAQAYVRTNYPEVYHSYQEFTNSERTAKRAPSLVEAEMAKGVTREVALQRVAQLHGFRAFDAPSRLNKRADDAEDQLIKSAEDLWASDPGMDRCAALRKARQENPGLFEALQAS